MSVPAYPEYKDSGVPWLGEVPRHWWRKPLFALAKELDERNQGMQEDNLLSLSYGKIKRKNIGDNDGLLPASFETYQIVERDDIVWRLTDLQNDQRSLRTGIVRERGIITSAYLATRPVAVLPEFLAYLLRAYDLTKVFYSMGGGLRQSMKFSDVKWLPIMLPSEAEQTAIATFLDRETAKIDALVAEQERLIALLKEKRQAVMSHAVTKGLNPHAPMKDSGIEWLGEIPAHWEVKAIRHFAEVLRGKFTHRPRNDPAYYDGDFPFIQTGDITGSGKFITTYRQTLNALGASVSKEFPAGTLVMAIAANIGDVAILEFPAYFPDSIVGLVPKNGVELTFLYCLMQAMKQPMLMTATVSTQMNLNVDQIVSMIAAQPPLDEQAAIVAHLEHQIVKTSQLVAEAQAAITLLQERRAALISAAVTGKIDVRGLVDASSEMEAA